MADDTAAAEAVETKPSLIKKLMIPLLLTVISSGGTFAGLKFSGLLDPSAPVAAEGEMAEGDQAPTDGEGGSHVGKPAFFVTLYPDLLVNFQADGRSAYLKITIDVMSHDEMVVKGIEEYQAIVRNNLLSAFQQVNFDTSKRQEGIEAMRSLALDEIKAVLTDYHGSADVEGVYFTSFVVQ